MESDPQALGTLLQPKVEYESAQEATNNDKEHYGMLSLADLSPGDIKLPEEGVNLDLSQVISVDTLSLSSYNTSFRRDRGISPSSLPASSTVEAGYSLLLPPGPRTPVVRQPLGPGSRPDKGFDRRKGVEKELDLRKEKTELIPHQASKLASSTTASEANAPNVPRILQTSSSHPQSQAAAHRVKQPPTEPSSSPQSQTATHRAKQQPTNNMVSVSAEAEASSSPVNPPMRMILI